MIIDYKLSYPSGTATAVLINGFHTTKGDKMAKYAILATTCYSKSTLCWILKQLYLFLQFQETGSGIYEVLFI